MNNKTARDSKAGKVDGRKDYISITVPGLSISVFKKTASRKPAVTVESDKTAGTAEKTETVKTTGSARKSSAAKKSTTKSSTAKERAEKEAGSEKNDK